MNALRKKRENPVTLIVGIVCRDGIVMASDSQTTCASMKMLDAIKMEEVEHATGRALIGGAGAVISSSRAMEYIVEHRSENKPLPDIAADAIKKTRDEFITAP